jgi:membrane associated rhomboid family serine protease
VSSADLFVVCKSCGNEVSPYITECPYCGNRLRKRAPKLDKGGAPRERRGLRAPRASLGRLRPGEIPGVRPDARPLATVGLLLASLVVSLGVRATLLDPLELMLVGRPGDEWWRVLTAPFVYTESGYAVIAGLGIGVFGWLLERRHGHVAPLAVFLAGASAGMALAAAVEAPRLTAGGNGAALALLTAWAVPDLRARRRGEETESDMLGVAVMAAVLALLPIASDSASWLSGLGGAVTGLLLGALLARTARA